MLENRVSRPCCIRSSRLAGPLDWRSSYRITTPLTPAPWVVATVVVGLLALLSPSLALAGSPSDAEPEVLRFVDESGKVVRTQTLADPAVVFLQDRRIDLRRQSEKAAFVDPEVVAPWILAFEGVPSSERISQLEKLGVQVVGTLPPAAYLVRADGEALARVGASMDLAASAPFEGDWKVSHRVPEGPVESTVEIVLYAGASTDSVLAELRNQGAEATVFTAGSRQIVRSELGVEGQEAVAALPEVEMVDAAMPGQFYNNEIRVVMQTEKAHFQANQAFYNPIYGIGVWGASQLVTLADSGLASHETFFGPSKVYANYAVPNTCVTGIGDLYNHGTGVANTALGDVISAGGAYGTANDLDGLSLRSTVAMQDINDNVAGFCAPNDYQVDLFYLPWTVGSMVHSNSWGHGAMPNTPMGTYSWRSQMIDEYMAFPAFREQAILFAAGNFGAHWSFGTYIPYSLSDESHSKNAIVVGGTGNGNARDFMYLFSSRGPTDDCLGTPCPGIQRVKPDVVAPATLTINTASSVSPTSYWVDNGTSYAAPAVAGAAALIRDYFAQGIYPVKPADPPLGGPPSSALVKAMLVNATVPIYDATGYAGNVGQGLPADAYPNYDQGYGRPVLDNVLEPAGYRKLKVYEDDTTTLLTGDVWQRTINFKEKWGADCNTLRITLAWNDPMATLAAGPKLVNDLDLEVTFNGTAYRGNHRLTGGLVFDSTNNVEDVFVPLGTQTLGILHKPVVRVYGSNVPQGPQPFALVATYGACADNIPCPPPPVAGGCYRGPGDTVPGSTWTPPVPGCDDQVYEMGEFNGSGSPYPFCEPPPIYTPVDPKPTEIGEL